MLGIFAVVFILSSCTPSVVNTTDNTELLNRLKMDEYIINELVRESHNSSGKINWQQKINYYNENPSTTDVWWLTQKSK